MPEQTNNRGRRAALPWGKRAERAAGRAGLWLVVGSVRLLPWRVAQAFGRGLGVLLFYVLGRYRRVALKNLNLIYGTEKSEAERREMAKGVFRHFGQMAVEFTKMPQLSREDMAQLCEVQGEENLRAAHAMGRGVMIMTGHFGNWEALARWLNLSGRPLHVVARKANDPYADRLLRDTREGGGARVHLRGSSARAVLQCLKDNGFVGILSDQNAADVFVPFLGERTGTADGPALIHLRTQAPMVFCWAVSAPGGGFRLSFDGPHVLPPTGDREADAARVMAFANAKLEEQVRAHPTQWLWLHDRWKASPGVFPGGEENARRVNRSFDRKGRATE